MIIRGLLLILLSWLRILSFVQDKCPNLPESLVLHIWSDGCAGQFRSRFVFSILSQFAMDHTLFCYYNEGHPGQGPTDGIGGTIKNRIFWDVKSEKVNIRDAKYFSSYANLILKGTRSLYMPSEEVLAEPENVSKIPKIPGALELYKISKSFNSDGVCKQDFFWYCS